MATNATLDLVVNSSGAIKSLKNVESALGGVDSKADKTKKKLGAGGIFGGIGKAAKKAAGFLTGPGGLVAGLGAVVGAGAGLSAIKDKLDWADTLQKSARQANITVEALSGITYASNQMGVSSDAMSAAMAKMNRRLGDFANRGSGAAKNALEALGVTQEDLNTKLTTGEQRFNAILEALMGIEDPAQRAKHAFDLGGIALETMVTQMDGTTEGFKALREEAVQVGATISTDFAQAAERVNDKLDKMGKTFGSIGIQIAEKLLPRLEPLLDKLLANAPAIVDAVVAAFDGLMKAFDALMPIVEALWPIFELLFDGIKTAWPAVEAVVNAIAPVIQAMCEGIRTALEVLPAWITEQWDKILQAWEAAKQGLKERIDDVVSFFEELPKKIEQYLQKTIDGIKQKWNELIAWLKSKKDELVDTVVGPFKWMYDQVVGHSYMTDLVDGVSAKWDQLINWLKSKKDALIDTVVGPFKWMYEKVVGGSIVPDLVEGVLRWFEEMARGMIEQTEMASQAVSAELDAIDQKLDVYQDRILRIAALEKDRQVTNQTLIGETIDLEGEHADAVAQTTDAVVTSVDIIGSLTSKVMGYVGGLIDKLTSKLGSFGGLLNGILKKVAGSAISKIGSKIFGGIGKIFGFADGGVIPAGRVGLVGEEGPEFISGPARITPMKGGGGQPVFNFSINNPQVGSGGSVSQGDLNQLAAGILTEARKMMIREQRYGGVLA